MTVSFKAQTLPLPEQAQARCRPPLRIALAGFGVVGQSLCSKLAGDPRFEISSILVRHPERERAIAPPVPLTSDLRAFFAQDADVLVDVLSCDKTGATVSGWALARGQHVVSASKRVISSRHSSLTQTALRSGAKLLHSAAVGGGAPILETVAGARGRAPIEAVAGVLNGTVNFILTRLARGDSLDEALFQARLAGFAEEDPSEDLSGADAAAKLRLIAHEAWGLDPAALDVRTEPLDRAAAEHIAASSERWIQHASLTRTGDRIEAEVALRPWREVESLPQVDDEWNCVAVSLADGSVVRCLGPGAGGAPTAESILSDLSLLLVEEVAAC